MAAFAAAAGAPAPGETAAEVEALSPWWPSPGHPHPLLEQMLPAMPPIPGMAPAPPGMPPPPTPGRTPAPPAPVGIGTGQVWLPAPLLRPGRKDTWMLAFYPDAIPWEQGPGISSLPA